MHIDIRRGNVRFPRAHALGLAGRLRRAFERLADRIVRIVVRLEETCRPAAPAKACTVEVHFPNGEVAIVTQRERRLGALVRRATERARRTALHALSRQPEPRASSMRAIHHPK